MKSKLLNLKKYNIPRWLGIILLGIIILRIPSLLEPYSYLDEMIYLTIGNGMKHGLTLYKTILDYPNKPPLLYTTAAISGGLFWFRAMLGLWMLASTVFFWKLCKNLFTKNELVVKVATITFAILTTLPLLEGNIANAELFIIGFVSLGFVFLLKQSLKTSDLVLGGIFLSLAALFKITAIFYPPVIVLFWVFSQKKINLLDKKLIKNTAILLLAFIAPILLTMVWYWAKGALVSYIQQAFLQNFGYLSSWRPGDEQKSFFVRNAPLLIRSVILLVSTAIVYIFRKKLGKGLIFSSLLLFFSLFAVTLSERPYPHYLVLAIPAVAILVGLLIASKKMDQIWAILPLGLALFVPVYYKFYYYDSISYYSRFAQFITGQISKEVYFDRFNDSVNKNYQIAQFLENSTQNTDSVLIWGGDAPTIYALSKRLPSLAYVATFHITDLYTPEQTLNLLDSNKPDFVIILPGSPNLPGLANFVQSNYLSVQTINGVDIWHKTSPAVLSGFYK